MKKYFILEKIRKNSLVAVVRGKSDEDAYEISKKIIEGGIKTIELTFSTPFIENTIERLSKEYGGDSEIIIGAGTVMDFVTARIAIMKGAKFIVSPHLDTEIAKICNKYLIPYLPGCGSVTEINNALESGCDVIKLFPATVLGPNFIKDVKGPMPYVNIMPSDGVTIENMKEWIDKGAFAIGIGGALTAKINELGYESVKEETIKFVEKYKSIR